MNKWEENIRKVVPYVPGEQPKDSNIIKLNTNENPYPPAKEVAEALASVDIDRLRLYPDPTVGDLVHALAQNYGVKDEQGFVGIYFWRDADKHGVFVACDASAPLEKTGSWHTTDYDCGISSMFSYHLCLRCQFCWGIAEIYGRWGVGTLDCCCVTVDEPVAYHGWSV